MDRLFLDCGAWTGNSTIWFKRNFAFADSYKYVLFECNPNIYKSLCRNLKHNQITASIETRAMWTRNGEIQLKIGPIKTTESASIIQEKRIRRYGLYPIDEKINCFDFSAWVNRYVKGYEFVVCKMNIEGAEYEILKKMVKDGSISKINLLFISWHWKKINMKESEHIKVINLLKNNNVKFETWGLEHE